MTSSVGTVSEPRIAFNNTVVLRYRLHLEAKHLAPATINLRLAAVRRLAYEAADVGLLSPELAASIRRVKGAKRLGVRLGNWLSAEQAKELIRCPDQQTTGGKRDHAILAVLLGCGLRRSEAVQLTVKHFQRRDEQWAIVDYLEKVATFGRSLFRTGSNEQSTTGSPPRALRPGGCSDVSPSLELSGVRASPRKWSGMLSASTPGNTDRSNRTP